MKWRNAETNPPKKDGEYIVHVKNLTGYLILDKPVFVARYVMDEWLFKGWEDNNVTHWMPLPKPPKENQ